MHAHASNIILMLLTDLCNKSPLVYMLCVCVTLGTPAIEAMYRGIPNCPYFTSFEKKVVHLKQQGNRSLGFTIRGGEHIVQFEFDLMHECRQWM